ncbi:peptidase inhibitor family I36 protein [Streptomyces sp. AM 4-1-1]|uniref:peptidase inhibitor family I36 protein n=1 Tax=Streptomyces sp. AM 4-1-1 TaxID=3028710 RepID=UPI0023B9F061|nr:peptidase inhibitor family I36 protein [Streptomyces sp. AM 4-1-1]WEH37023.1 peptidase inhibitor family I36 protein [Streptomyces sp. AM 4-1-1]
MNRITALAAASILLTGALGAGSTATAAVRFPSAGSPSASYSCTGKFCIYNGWDGSGSSCQWSGDKANTADGCSFIKRGGNVRSVWNGTGGKVTYYTQTNYKKKVGSTPAGQGGNLQGNYQIRSFKH